MRYHFAAEVSNLLPLETQFNHAEGSVGQIHHRTAQRLVKRHVGGPKPGKAGGGSQSLREGIAQGKAAVLGRMVIINCSPGRTAISKRDLRWQARKTTGGEGGDPRNQGLGLKVGGARTRRRAMRDDVL